MPGKLPGGKVRISKTAPSILSNVKVSPSSEVKYYGLVRDQALDDIQSKPDALEEVLQDVQDPAERKAEGAMNQTDLSIIDGIVSFDIKYEDLEVLQGGSLKDGQGEALVNPRQRLADRISQFESFAGRGTPFKGAGPVKFYYIVPRNGDLLDGTVSITTGGVVTGSGTTLDTDLNIGDYVILCKEDGVTPERLASGDQAVYKVTGITSNTSITVQPNPASAVGAGRKFRKRYCHNSPPPFYTEDLTSTAFNAPDHIPAVADIDKSHRQGYVLNGEFKPFIDDESWWEGAYDQELRERSEYGGIGNNSDADPKFPKVKDGNINYEFAKEDLTQDINFGFRYDFLFKSGFAADRDFYKWLVRVNGRIRIDYFNKTGIDPSTGVAQGTWVNAIDTFNPNTFFTQVSKEDVATNVYGYRTSHLQGGPDYAASSAVDTTNVQDLSATYTDRENNTNERFRDDYVPVVIRYWYGQDTIDNSSSPIDISLRSIQASVPSFTVDTIPTNLPSNLHDHWNNYFGLVQLTYNDGVADATGYGRWDVSGTPPANYEANASEFNRLVEVQGYTDDSAPSAPTTRDYSTWTDLIAEFDYIPPNEPLIATKVWDSGTSAFKNEFTINFPEFSSPSNGDVVWAMLQNRPESALPQINENDGYNTENRDELWQKYLFNPNPTKNYSSVADMLEGGDNYVEPNPQRVPFENNPEYFKYKYGKLPALNTYGADRYDGTITNRITESDTERDYDYSHTKLLFLGRQKKDTSVKPLASGETRNNAENYTFIKVEADQAGNGGEVVILARPVNSSASFENTAGEGDGGKVLHATNNTTTFSNANRQNIGNIVINYLPFDGLYDNLLNPTSVYYQSFLGRNILALVDNFTGSPVTYDTSGIIASSTFGHTERDPARKSAFITSFDKNNGTERFFYGFLPVERRSENAQLTLEAGGFITSSTLFSNDNGDITTDNQPYIGAIVEFYASTDSSYSTILATKTVSAYDAANERAELNTTTNLTAGTLYNIRVYYNYLIISSEVPSVTTTSNGTRSTDTFPTINTPGTPLQIRYVYNTSYSFSRADSGSGLNFAETLFVSTTSSPTAESPFGPATELPAPPSGLVTPFGFDRGPTDPNNPGLGGICYPPYESQNLALQPTIKSDTELYSESAGNFDVYFGSPQVSQTNLGVKYLQVTDQLLFDFEASQRSSLISETGSFPTFDSTSYTHKLKVELNPDIAGLFTRSSYTGVSNENIFKDALKYSNNKPVKEIFWMFAKKDSSGTDISLLTANNPGW